MQSVNPKLKKIVISLGGSLVIPNGGIDVNFLSDFNAFIRKQLKKDPTFHFFIVVGGGATARHYRDAGRDVVGHELTVRNSCNTAQCPFNQNDFPRSSSSVYYQKI